MAQTNKIEKINNKDYLLNNDGTPSFAIVIDDELNSPFIARTKKALNGLYELGSPSTKFTEPVEFYFLIFNELSAEKTYNILHANNIGADVHILHDGSPETYIKIDALFSVGCKFSRHDITDDPFKIIKSLIAKKSYGLSQKTDRWEKLRKAAIEKAENRCQLCNTLKSELNVHHRCYTRKGTEDESKDLIVLCRNCHDLVHKNLKIK